MTRTIGKNRDTYGTTDNQLAIELNSTSYTQILMTSIDRLGYMITNDNAEEILVKEASPFVPDDDDRGFIVWGRTVYESPESPIYTGRVSAKSKTGTPSVLVVEK